MPDWLWIMRTRRCKRRSPNDSAIQAAMVSWLPLYCGSAVPSARIAGWEWCGCKWCDSLSGSNDNRTSRW